MKEKMINVFDKKYDKKVNAKCLLIDINIGRYIELIENSLEDMDIQRGKLIQRNDVYKRLTEDLKYGTIIPPLSLILKKSSGLLISIKDLDNVQDIENEVNEKIQKGDLSILDGLQRTYCILNVVNWFKDSGNSKNMEEFLNRRIRAELWYDINYISILYKMLVLNTGQVKMSMRHQIEILNPLLKEKILETSSSKKINIEFSTYKNPLSTDKPYSYKFSDIVESFTAFITKDPVVDKLNIVVQELEKMEFIESHSKSEMLLNEEEVNEFIEVLLKLDEGLSDKYPKSIETTDENNEPIKIPWTSRNEIMTSSPILGGVFAGFGKAFNNDTVKYKERKKTFFDILSKKDETDPLRLEIMSKILQDEKKRTKKFGETARKFFYEAVKIFFNGEDDFRKIWTKAIENR